MVHCEQDVEQEKQINIADHGETEGIAGFKYADEHLIEEKENSLNQKDQEKTENDEEKGLESQVQDLQKSEDPDNADILVQCEFYGQDVEQDKLINMMDHGETGGFGGFKLSDEHPIDEKENNLDQKDQKKTENDEDQGLESQVQDLQKSKDPDTADVMVQCEQDVEQEKQINIADSGETEDIGGFKHSDEHLIDEIEEQIVDQKDRGRTEKDEDQGTESQVQDLLPQLEYLKKYSDEIACISKNEVEEMMPETRDPTEQGKEKETVQDLDEIGQLEQSDGDNEYKEECDQNHEDEGCAMESEDLDNADVMVQSELYGQDVEQEMQISGMDHAEKEGIGGFKHSDEHPIDEKENNLDQKDQEKTENDEEQGLESQVQDLQKSEDPNNSDILVQSELYGQDVEQDKLISMMDHAEKEGTGGFKHSDEHLIDEIEEQIVDQKDRERAENDEDQGLESQVQDLQKSEDPDNADIMVQCEQDVEQEKQINIVEHGETEGIGGFKHSDGHSIDEKEKQNVDPMDQEMTENDEEQGIESQVQDLLPQREYFTEEADDLAKPEMLNLMEKYSDEIDEFSKKGVEEVMLETEQDEDTTESEHDTTKYELMESVETLQKVSEELSEKKVPNVELKMTTVVDEFFETVYTLEDSLLSDSKQDTSEKTPETGTGSSMVAMKTEGMVSDLIVCEFPGESSKGPETALAETDLGCFEEIKSNLHDPQTLAEEQAEREAVVVCSVEHSETLKTVETEQDIETLIESLGTTESHAHQEIDKTKFSHKEHVELRTELSEETTDTKISSEDEEAEPSEKEGQSLVIRNVTLQSHELLEFKEGECKSSLGTMDTFSESLGNSSVSEIAENAEIEHVAEEQTDVKPVLTRSLSSAGFLEETVHLQDVSERRTEEQEILETALEYVEGITNQVLKDMIETEVNLVQETEPLAGPSSEEPGDAEYQGPAQCVSADAFVLEEEGKLLGETMESKVEMEVETTSSEVLKQTEQHISSPVCETTEADGCRDIAGATVLSSHEDLMEVSRPGMKRGFDQVNKDLAEVKTERKFDLYLQAFEESSLDFTIQKTRIAVKNPLVRPPKDPRRLLFKASVEPLVSQPSPRSQKVEVSVPSKGVTGFKLPGLGAELPVLRKTEFGKKTREGGAAERTLQPQQKSVAVTEDSVKQEQAPVPVPAKPKWTPPKHPGMGSPFMMAELKSKLKKPVQE
ncbi:midasin-like [Cyprinus carpio]|uniref:Midasin-like n=1 Tax=Cyprinus carpio TaxID=7962 RepID=A0A9Q9ZL65_CYPCA|nr:midasin-like [Cyprinus carpio]